MKTQVHQQEQSTPNCDSAITPCLQFRVVNRVTIVDPQLGVPIRGFSVAASVRIGVADCVATVDRQLSPMQLLVSLESIGREILGVGGGCFRFPGTMFERWLSIGLWGNRLRV